MRRLGQKVDSNKTKHLLVENEIYKLKRTSKVYKAVKDLLEENGVQNYSVFQLMGKYLEAPNNKNYVLEWKHKAVSDKSIKPPTTINNIRNPLLEYGNKLKLKWKLFKTR